MFLWNYTGLDFLLPIFFYGIIEHYRVGFAFITSNVTERLVNKAALLESITYYNPETECDHFQGE